MKVSPQKTRPQIKSRVPKPQGKPANIAARKPAASTPATYRQPIIARGIWLTENEYAERFRISRQTLANWRFKEERGEQAANRPIWRRFGTSIRYFLPAEEVVA